VWTTRQLLQFSVKLIRDARRTFNEDEQDKIAGAIVEDLERSN
jgi:hypothetical protein